MNSLSPRRFLLRLLALLPLLSAPLLTTAGDWPTYLHDPSRTASGDERILSGANVPRLTALWSFKTHGAIAASATVVDNTAYVGSWDGFEYAINAVTGVLKWRTYLGKTTSRRPDCYPHELGVSSTAAVQGGVVYVGGGAAYWYALQAATGKVLWRIYTGDNSEKGGHYNWSSPLIYNGYAYIGVASLGDCPEVQGQLLRVNLRTHRVVNRFDVVPNGQVGGTIWGSPSVDPATSTIYFADGNETIRGQTYAQGVVAVDATTMKPKGHWRLPSALYDDDWGSTATLFHNAAGAPLMAAPNKDGFVYAFRRDNLNAGPLWRRRIAVGGPQPENADGSISSEAFGQGRLYAAGGRTRIGGASCIGAVRALDPATGNVLWQYCAPGSVIPALAYANGFVLVGAGNTLEALDAASGVVLYSDATDGTILGAPSVSNGRIFTSSSDGNLYAFGLREPCPSGWNCADIGHPSHLGNQSLYQGLWTVDGSGADIWNNADQFHYVWRTLSGDGSISARITTQTNSDPWAKAGVMLRANSDSGAPFYDAVATPGYGVSIMYRATPGGYATEAARPGGKLPVYLKVARMGTTYTAYTSRDGLNWTEVPGSTVTLNVNGSILAGLAISSHNTRTIRNATFDHVLITAVAPSATTTPLAAITATPLAAPTATPLAATTPVPTAAVPTVGIPTATASTAPTP